MNSKYDQTYCKIYAYIGLEPKQTNIRSEALSTKSQIHFKVRNPYPN